MGFQRVLCKYNLHLFFSFWPRANEHPPSSKLHLLENKRRNLPKSFWFCLAKRAVRATRTQPLICRTLLTLLTNEMGFAVLSATFCIENAWLFTYESCFLLIKSTSFIPDKMQTIRKKLCHSKTPGTSWSAFCFQLFVGFISNLRPYSSANYGAKFVQEVKKQEDCRRLLKTTRIS